MAESLPKCFGTYQEGQFAPAPNVCAYSCTERDRCRVEWSKWTADCARAQARKNDRAFGPLIVSGANALMMYEAGAPTAKIAELLKVNPTWVTNILRSDGADIVAKKVKKWEDRRAEVKKSAPWGRRG